MSFQAMAWATKQALSCHQKLVLIMLADMADADGCCWPTIKTLAHKCGMSAAQTRKCISKLEKSRFVIRESRVRKHGSTSNMFHLEVGYTPTPIECPSHSNRVPEPIT